MITYTELRRLSLDFRRLSSNFLNSTDDTAATMIQRFKKYIDDTPFISGIISDAIGEVDYDWQNCFRQSKHSGWHEIEVPVDEACHVKAMYDYLDYIISNGSNILGIAMHYSPWHFFIWLLRPRKRIIRLIHPRRADKANFR